MHHIEFAQMMNSVLIDDWMMPHQHHGRMVMQEWGIDFDGMKAAAGNDWHC